MFRSVFRPYGPVWTFLNNLTDVLGLSLLWCLCSLPLVTLGAATTALYDAAIHGIRYQEGGAYRRFFRTFRTNLKTASAVTLLWGSILLFGSFVLFLLTEAAQESPQAAVMAGAYQVLMLLPLTALVWSAILLSRFAYRFRALTVAALQFLMQHLLSSALIGVVTWASLWACREYVIPILFLPATLAIAWSLAAEPIFQKLGAGLCKQNRDPALPEAPEK